MALFLKAFFLKSPNRSATTNEPGNENLQNENGGFQPNEYQNKFETTVKPNIQKIKTIKVGNTFAQFKWNDLKKERSFENSLIEKYQISLNKILSSGSSDNVRLDFVNASQCTYEIEGLIPRTKYQICVNAIEKGIRSTSSCQFFYTTDKDELTGIHLGKLWLFLLSNSFNKAIKSEEIIRQMAEFSTIKKRSKSTSNFNETDFVLQLLASIEFRLFVKKCAKMIIDGMLSSSDGEKFKQMLLPLHTGSDEILDYELIVFLTYLTKGCIKGTKNDVYPSILNLVQMFCKDNEKGSFYSEFSIMFSKFLFNVSKRYSQLEKFILFLMLQKYDIVEKNMTFSDVTVNISELLFDLVLFEEQNLQQAMSNYSCQVNCIKYAMKYSYHKKEDFKTILSIFSTSETDIVGYMKMFLSQWRESKLEEFINAIVTKNNIAEFFKQSGMQKGLAEKFSGLCIRKNLYEESFNEEFLQVGGKTVRKNFIKLSIEIFEKLEFKNYLKDYISKQDIYRIENMSENLSDPLPILFLKKLLMLDYRCRSTAQLQKAVKENCLESNSNENDEKSDDVFAAAYSAEVQDLNYCKSPDSISSADVVLAALIACDPFFLQDVFEKLAACQLAVPVLFSNPKTSVVYNLWALKGIQKKWLNTNTGKSYEANITSYSCETISFCRVGQISTSKSKVANVFLSSAQGRFDHSFFLNRDNDNLSLLNSGNIEVCWYTPEGSDKEKLHDLTCFYNLRGDVRDHPSCFDFLLAISNVLVIFIGKDSLSKGEQDKLKATKAKVILIQTTIEGKDKLDSKINLLFSKGKTISSTAELISKCIEVVNKDSCNDTLKNMEEHAGVARKLGFAIDEDSHYCEEGKKHAAEFIKCIEKYELEKLKEEVAPLQGNNWKAWTEKDKEEVRHRLRPKRCNPQNYSSDLREQKRKFREQQMQIGLSDAMRKFLQSLLQLPKFSWKFYLHYIQLYLNNLSESNLPKLLKSYNDCRNKLNSKKRDLEKFYKDKSNDIQKEKGIKTNIDQLVANVKSYSKKFDVASFGIEHIFREIAQTYECFSEADGNIPEVIDELPKIMTELMIEGYPLEIMDGNVSHIPISWLEKVLLQLKKRLKNSNIYVVSILGIQSSGKSTFLNTMHGCRFPVSSGRCTKGVFVQLVPVKREFQKTLKCDYYLLMDTEGLRSPELGDSFHHDNEIATLISCLANLTIINFWGQTFSKDMADVIVIAAHAYMRMKKVKIKSSFHMIFAGVHDITAAEKNEYGVSQITEEINTIIEKVAKSEGRVDLFRGMKSIFPMLQESYENIAFPQFLPVLWHSSMSPPESIYGELIKNLKISIMKTLSDVGGYRHVQSIQEFINRLKDIWDAIKKENFVFGFRNSQALDVYNQMHLLYEKALTDLRSLFFKEAWPLENIIYEKMKKNEGDLDKLVSSHEESIKERLSPLIHEKSKKAIEILQEYISKLTNPDYGMMHLEKFELHLESTITQLLDDEMSRVKKNIKVQKKSKSLGYLKQNEFRQNFLVEARKLAIAVRSQKSRDKTFESTNVGKAFETLINSKFEGLYAEFLKEATKEDSRMFDNRKELFLKLFANLQSYLEEKLNLLNLKNDNEMSKYINNLKARPDNNQCQIMQLVNNRCFKDWYGRGKANLMEDAVSKLNIIKDKVTTIMSDISSTNLQPENVLTTVMDFVSGEIVRGGNDSLFTREFRAQIFANVYAFVIMKLTDFEIENMKRFSLVSFLDKEKCTFKEMFIDDCTTANIEVKSIQDYFKFVLLESIILRLKRYMGNSINDYFIKIEIFSNKKRMFYEIEKELLDGSASTITNYSSFYEVFVKKWMNERVDKLCDEFLKNEIKRRAEIEKEKIYTILKEVDISFRKNESNHNGWFEILEEKLKTEPMVQNGNGDTTFHKISNANFVMDELKRLIETTTSTDIFDMIVDKSKQEFGKNDNLSILQWFEFNPLDNLFKERLGCTAQCPFCGVKCSSDLPCPKNFRHKASMHRPQGLLGWRNTLTRKLVPDICTFLVGSDKRFRFSDENKKKYNIEHDNYIPFKDVRDIITDWDIPEIFESESTEFWQYLFVQNQEALAKEWMAVPADYPSGWNSVTRSNALHSLQEIHGVTEED